MAVVQYGSLEQLRQHWTSLLHAVVCSVPKPMIVKLFVWESLRVSQKPEVFPAL